MDYKIIYNFLIFYFFAFCKISSSNLYIIGYIKEADGIGQIAPNIISMFENKKDINIQLIESRPWISQLNYYNEFLKNIINSKVTLNEENILFKKRNISIFTDTLWYPNWNNIIKLSNNGIKFVYSMTEYTKVADEWVKKINKYFDAVLVPDEYLISVYRKSGVIKPIFALPIPIKLEEFLLLKKPEIKKPFVFGCSATFTVRKNHHLLIDAFAKAFKNNKDVILKIHGRYGDYKSLLEHINKLKVNNIQVINKEFSRNDYINFFSSLNCYVFLSKGEGFSITPREALAAGIPCILSNNTTHKKICNTGFVYSIPAEIIEPAYSEAAKKWIGYDFNCKIHDVSQALKQMTKNYNYYLNKAQGGRQWVRRYTIEELRKRYLTILKPKKVIFDNYNKITKNSITTNCKKLYEKYLNYVEKTNF